MKIYIASSWKNAEQVRECQAYLEAVGHKADAFCNDTQGRYVFSYTEIGNVDQLNAVTFLADPRSRRAFQEDKKWLDWADAVVLLLPCGRSAHLEAGYAVGQGKPLIIHGGFEMGEFDVMYGFADALVETFAAIDVVLSAFP